MHSLRVILIPKRLVDKDWHWRLITRRQAPLQGCRTAREFDAAMWNFIRKIWADIFLDCYRNYNWAKIHTLCQNAQINQATICKKADSFSNAFKRKKSLPFLSKKRKAVIIWTVVYIRVFSHNVYDISSAFFTIRTVLLFCILQSSTQNHALTRFYQSSSSSSGAFQLW